MVDKKAGYYDFINNFLYPIFGFIAFSVFVGTMWIKPEGEIRSALKACIAVISAVFGGFYLTYYLTNSLLFLLTIKIEWEKTQQFIGYTSLLLYILFSVTGLLSIPIWIWGIVLYTVFIAYVGVALYLQINDARRLLIACLTSFIVITVLVSVFFILQALIINV